MIKTAAYFPLQSALNAKPVLSAVCTSMVWNGITMQKDSMDSDCAVIWSVLWHGRMKQNRHVYEHYRSLGRPVIVIDVGYLQRGVTWRIGVNHINRQADFGDHRNLDPDRPAKLGVTLKQADKHPEILIALQHSRSLQTESMEDTATWALQKIRQIRQYSDRPIVIRPHPRDRVIIDNLPNGVRVEHPRRLADTYDSYDWNDRYHAVINHNSGPGVLAAIAGVRPVVDESSLAWPVSVSMADIEKSYSQDRRQWLIELSHYEYTVPEIESGVWLKKLECSLS